MADILKEEALKWEEKYRYGTVEDRKKRMNLWEPYYSYVYEPMLKSAFSLSENNDEFIKELTDKGILNANSTVIDIGCGVGGYTFRIAPIVKSIVAMDINKTALDIIKKRAKETNLNNIEVTDIPWEDYSVTRRFDVSFSSMCPAICNIDEIKKMESMTSGYCVLVTVMAGSYDKHRKAMMGELNIHPEGMVTDYDTYLNVLKAMGREVMTANRSFKREYKTSLEELLLGMPTYFKIFGIDNDKAIAFVKDYFERNSVDGYLNDESLMNMGMIYWKPLNN